MKRTHLLALASVFGHGLMMVLSASIDAAPMASSTTGDAGTLVASSDDLINQSTLTFLSSSYDGADNFGSGVTNANDGVVPTAGGNDNSTASLNPLDGNVAIFNLDTTTNVQGYDITSIVTMTGYAGIFTDQKYDVAYSVVGSGDFNFLTSVDFPDGQFSRTVTIVDDSTGPLATNVDALRFTFAVAGAIGPIYREFDVIGGPSVAIPEPSSFLLAAIGLLAAATVARRRKR